MKFIWEDTEIIGFYECKLISNSEAEIESICFWDYSNEYQIKEAINNHWKRPYCYKVQYCNGYCMERGFDKTEDNTKYGYNGTKEHTVEDIKKWCENYIASLYINCYNNILARLEEAKKQAEWFIENGYEVIKED